LSPDFHSKIQEIIFDNRTKLARANKVCFLRGYLAGSAGTSGPVESQENVLESGDSWIRSTQLNDEKSE